LLKAIGDELAFAQEELTYLNRLDITKENTLLHLAVVVTEQFVFYWCPVKSGSKWRISLVFQPKPIYANMRGLEKR
jgi:hypothetical protein